AESSAVSVTPAVTVPDAPTGLSAAIDHGAVVLRWTPPFGMVPRYDPAQYRIYRGGAAAGPFEVVGETSPASFIDRTAKGGATYFYVVSATSAAGEGAQSRPVKVAVPR